MPHVKELKFHRPRPDEYQIWEKILERTGYRVCANTRICSNHFRHGMPVNKNRVPRLYIRSYPHWAVSKEEALRRGVGVSDNIVCEILAHMAQYLDQAVADELMDILKQNSQVDEPGHICRVILKLNKEKARQYYGMIAQYVPAGKVVEAFAVYQHGVSIDGVKLIAPVPQKIISAIQAVSQVNSTGNVKDIAHDHQYERISTSPSEENQNVRITESKCSKCRKQIQVLTGVVDELKIRIANLEADNENLKVKNSHLEAEKQAVQTRLGEVNGKDLSPVCIKKIEDSDELMTLHTGLPSCTHFTWICHQVFPAAERMVYWKGSNTADNKNISQQKRGPSRSLSLENELLITLMKLKLNLTEDFLAFLFSVSASLISSIISTWIPLLSRELECLIYWPSRPEVLQCYPHCFRRWSGITAVVDCFEIPTEKPSHVSANTQIFSSYKNRPTVKFLLACTPGGSVSFISEPAGGNMSDKELFLKSNIMDKFSVGDKCMADKGFRLKGELMERGVELVLPPFVQGGKPFTPEENELNKVITTARIHVERVIGRVRCYQYLNGVIPLTQLDLVGSAAVVCCILTNLKPSVMVCD